MTKFLSVHLYDDMNGLIDQLDDLRDTLKEARDTSNYEEFDDLMASAWEGTQSLSSDIDYLRVEGSELHANEEDDE